MVMVPDFGELPARATVEVVSADAFAYGPTAKLRVAEAARRRSSSLLVLSMMAS